MSKKAHDRANTATIRGRDKIVRSSEKQTIRSLNDTSFAVQQDIKNIDEDDWKAYRLPVILEGTTLDIEQMQAQMTTNLNNDADKMFDYGVDRCDIEMIALGAIRTNAILSSAIVMPEKMLIGTLIKGFSQDQIKQVSNIVTRGVMSGKSTSQVAKEIKQAFKISENRAKMIANTEINRTHSYTDFNRMKQYQKVNKNLRKIWMWTGKPNGRKTHEQADFTYNLSPIHINEPFFVGGEYLMFPRDPAGSASNTIYCGCWMDEVLV